jgi:hypothetical protein
MPEESHAQSYRWAADERAVRPGTYPRLTGQPAPGNKQPMCGHGFSRPSVVPALISGTGGAVPRVWQEDGARGCMNTDPGDSVTPPRLRRVKFPRAAFVAYPFQVLSEGCSQCDRGSRDHIAADAVRAAGQGAKMTMTPSALTRASGAAAIAAGVLFIGVQIGHPDLDSTSITTTDVFVRDQLKVLMAVLALVGITGMYLSQIGRNGILGLVGYSVLAVAYLLILCGVYTAAYVWPEVAESSAGYVNDYIAADTGRGTVEGDLGALGTVIQLRGFAYLVGGLLFGIALYRAHVLARWAAALLAVGGLVSVVLALMPDAFYRLLAVPNGIAMIGLGYSLWRTTRPSVSAISAGQDVRVTPAAE